MEGRGVFTYKAPNMINRSVGFPFELNNSYFLYQVVDYLKDKDNRKNLATCGGEVKVKLD
jgi:hypothetical protein